VYRIKKLKNWPRYKRLQRYRDNAGFEVLTAMAMKTSNSVSEEQVASVLRAAGYLLDARFFLGFPPFLKFSQVSKSTF
jgi:hypothetical protein